MKCAILGANGFIGMRTVERFLLEQLFEVRPIVRTFSSLSRVARFGLDWKIADARDEEALVAAFSGCEIVIHSAIVDPVTIVQAVKPMWRAAERANVRRIIYLSSASVHGPSPPPGTDEESALSTGQTLAYNNARVVAERKLRKLHGRETVELVILRPSIVYGPRSTWITGFCEELLAGRAYIISDGQGIFNGVYVDNLIQAIQLAISVREANGHTFLIGENEKVTWGDFYRTIADAFEIPMTGVPGLACPSFKSRWDNTVLNLMKKTPFRTILPHIDRKIKEAVKAAMYSLTTSPTSLWSLPSHTAPVVRPMTALLQQCQHKLPFDKARRILGYEPPISFAEGMRRSIAWLRFAGYPVKQ